MNTYKEGEYTDDEVYRVKYDDGATYQYGIGYAVLIENIPPDVLKAQKEASFTSAKPPAGIPWFDGAGSLMFFVFVIVPVFSCVFLFGAFIRCWFLK